MSTSTKDRSYVEKLGSPNSCKKVPRDSMMRIYVTSHHLFPQLLDAGTSVIMKPYY